MKLLGIQINPVPLRIGFKVLAQTFSQIPTSSSWFGIIREAAAGNWQSNVEVDAPRVLLQSSAVFACATTIAGDISKLRIKLMRDAGDGLTEEVMGARASDNSPFLSLLRKPNHYQNRMKFVETWIMSKLLAGNAYILKERDRRNVVRALYPLDPNRCTPMIADDGSVWYDLKSDPLSKLQPQGGSIRVPASEIIHDPMVALWHPLVGVTPIYACAASATLSNKITANSTNLFANAARPSGILTAPGAISDTTAQALKTQWEENFRGQNIGRLAVVGDGLKYEAIAMKAEDAQLIQQLNWTGADIARAFKMPAYKIGIGAMPAYNNIEALNQMYYSDCLQVLIEQLELALNEGIELPNDLETEVDLDGLLRMDSATLYERNNKAVAGGWFAPDEARRTVNLRPVPGGDSPLMQQQNWTLKQLAERPPPQDSTRVAPAPGNPPPPTDEEDQEDDEEMMNLLRRRLEVA